MFWPEMSKCQNSDQKIWHFEISAKNLTDLINQISNLTRQNLTWPINFDIDGSNFDGGGVNT